MDAINPDVVLNHNGFQWLDLVPITTIVRVRSVEESSFAVLLPKLCHFRLQRNHIEVQLPGQVFRKSDRLGEEEPGVRVIHGYRPIHPTDYVQQRQTLGPERGRQKNFLTCVQVCLQTRDNCVYPVL